MVSKTADRDNNDNMKEEKNVQRIPSRWIFRTHSAPVYRTFSFWLFFSSFLSLYRALSRHASGDTSLYPCHFLPANVSEATVESRIWSGTVETIKIDVYIVSGVSNNNIGVGGGGDSAMNLNGWLSAETRVRCCTFACNWEGEWMDIYGFGTTRQFHWTYLRFTYPTAAHTHIRTLTSFADTCVCVWVCTNGLWSQRQKRIWYTFCFSACSKVRRVKVVVVFLRPPQFLDWYVTIHILIFQRKLYTALAQYTGNCR